MSTLSFRGFSQREQQIVGAVLEAKAVKDIALELDLSINTVKDYLKTIYRKAQVHSARELMVRLGAAGPAGAPPDTALAQLLQTAQALAARSAPSEALQQLAAAVRRCTRARRVGFFRPVRLPGEPLYLAGEGTGTPLRVGGFASQVLERGWARLDAGQMRGPEGRLFGSQGWLGEVIGVACTPTVRVQILLAGDPSEGSFGALDGAVIRLLARLACSDGEQHRFALSATA